MWKSLQISQQTYFIYCNINASKEEVTFVFYDLKEAWCETVALKDVKLKVKVLNKRFDFNEDNIKEALSSGEIKFAAIEEPPHTSAIKQNNLLLKVKYGVKNCVLNYEWSLRRQSILEFQTDFVQPLLIALVSCLKQVEILTECIRKKDAELHQYRLEGAVLGRKTLATKPFDFDSFYKNYEEGNKMANDFKELALYVLESQRSTAAKATNDKIKLQTVVEEEKPSNIHNNANRRELTPKRRKRRKELELLHLERHIKIRKEGLQYESSQSQSISSENSQTHEEIKKETIKEKPLFEADHNIESTRNHNDAVQSRKKTENEAVVDTDSGSDRTISLPEHGGDDEANKSRKPNDNTNLKSLKERKRNYSPQNSIAGTQIKSINIFEFSTDTEEDQKSLQESEPNTPLHTKSKNLRHSPLPPVIDDLSSQLNTIKKELECLEAMRLADLKKRFCKA